MSLKLKAVSDSDTDPKNPNSKPINENIIKREVVDLRNGSEVLYIQRFFNYDQSWKWFHFLNNHIPWTRPTVRVFGRSCLQVLPILFYLFLFYFFTDKPHRMSQDDLLFQKILPRGLLGLETRAHFHRTTSLRKLSSRLILHPYLHQNRHSTGLQR